jgi:hypothetical protein
MTHFEYVSVAVSLVFALAVADVLRALIPAARAPSIYWPHFAWLITMVLIIAYTWWTIWNWRNVSWTGLRFAYALTNPALLTIATRLLTHRDPDSVESFRDHFHGNRRVFFAALLAFCVNGSLAAWAFGIVPFGEFPPVLAASLPGSAAAVAGLFLRTDRAHAVLVVLVLLIVLAALAFIPTLPDARSAA